MLKPSNRLLGLYPECRHLPISKSSRRKGGCGYHKGGGGKGGGAPGRGPRGQRARAAPLRGTGGGGLVSWCAGRLEDARVTQSRAAGARVRHACSTRGPPRSGQGSARRTQDAGSRCAARRASRCG